MSVERRASSTFLLDLVLPPAVITTLPIRIVPSSSASQNRAGSFPTCTVLRRLPTGPFVGLNEALTSLTSASSIHHHRCLYLSSNILHTPLFASPPTSSYLLESTPSSLLNQSSLSVLLFVVLVPRSSISISKCHLDAIVSVLADAINTGLKIEAARGRLRSLVHGDSNYLLVGAPTHVPAPTSIMELAPLPPSTSAAVHAPSPNLSLQPVLLARPHRLYQPFCRK